MLDAYSIRKAIPRLVIAVIAINISIYLCLAAVDIANVVGRGLFTLLTGEFLKDGAFNTINIENNAENNTVLGVLGVGGALTAAITVMWVAAGPASAGLQILGFLLPLIITISLVALAVLITVVIRYGLVLFLVVISPVAIACSVLPGTEKYFKQWWDLFLKTLLVYPIITAIFAIANVLAAILLSTAASQSDAIGLAQLVGGVVALYTPLFLIPFAFKFAGGAMAAVLNAANGTLGKAGLAQRTRQAWKKAEEDPNTFLGGRKSTAKGTRRERGQTAGQFFAGTAAGIKGLRQRNDIAEEVTLPDGTKTTVIRKGNRVGFRGAYSAASQARGSVAAAREAAHLRENLHGMQDFLNDDDASKVQDAYFKGMRGTELRNYAQQVAASRYAARALTSDEADAAGISLSDANTAEAIAGRTRALNDVMARTEWMGGKMSNEAGQQAAIRGISSTTTGFLSPAEMTRRAIEASRGPGGQIDNQRLAMILAKTKEDAKATGRYDYANISFPKHLAVAQAMAYGSMDETTAQDELSELMFEKGSGGILAGMDKRGIQQLVDHKKRVLTEKVAGAKAANPTASDEEILQNADVQKQLADIANLYDSMAGAPKENIDLWEDLLAYNITGSGDGARSVQQNIETVRADQKAFKVFANRRREYGRAEDAERGRPADPTPK